MNKKKRHAFIPAHLRPWIEARSRWGHAQVQMARALGMNPNKLGKLANHRQEPWKAPLPDFIERIYFQRFGKLPEVIRTIEEVAAAEMAKRQSRRLRKQSARPDAVGAADARHREDGET